MYLSMWMLANRLVNLDLDIDISKDSPAVLRSARLACATNCVRVYQKGTDCVCSCGEDKIYIHDADIAEAFELVQSVFDFYEDWSRNITELAARKAYQQIVERCGQVFHSPLVIMDGNCKVLGISSQYAEMDEEWKYLTKYGHSSVKALQYMRREDREAEFREFDNPVAKPFSFSKGYLHAMGMTCPILYGSKIFGRINLFERERALNSGDKQLLNFIASVLAPSLGASGNGLDFNPNAELFSNLLDGKEVREDDVDRTVSVMHWDRSSCFQVTVLNYISAPKEKIEYYTLVSTLYSLFPESYVILRNGTVVVIAQADARRSRHGDEELGHKEERSNQNREEVLLDLCNRNNIQFFRSLPLKGIKNLHYCFCQAMFALSQGRADKGTRCDFYSVAIDYIIRTADFGEILQACHPDIVFLNQLQKTANYEMVGTLKCYLDHNQSILHTANAMYLHRNSMVYRIQRITECLQYDLDDAYNRDYMRLSIRILELSDSRCPEQNLDPNQCSA